MLILSTSDIPTCQLPTVLQVIYFGKLIFNILAVLLPIALILLIMIDFTKCLVSNDESNQKRVANLAFKRIFYTVIVFAVPYIVSFVMGILTSLIPDYNLCLTNATPENIDVFTKEYEKEVELEEQERLAAIKENSKKNISDKIINNIGNFDLNNFENLSQFDSRWKDYPLCVKSAAGSKTISQAGCGFVSYTMVLRSYGYTDIYPNDVLAVTCDKLNMGKSGYAVPADYFKLSEYYGFKAQSIGKTDYSSMEKALHEGKRLIVNIPGHYISILGIRDDNTVIIGDSSRDYARTGPYTMKSLAGRSGTFLNVTAVWKD